jgi:polysaccharide pyruvyl transferase WcaK-like protein
MINLFCIRPHGFNVGNDVIFLGLQHFLRESFGEVVNLISLPATSRYESQAKAGLTGKTIYEINQYGHGVIVGGGNLYENGELDVNLDALPSLEVPLFLFSLSRGRIYNRRQQLVARTDAMPERVIQALHRKACRSLARDQATFTFLQRIGCDPVLGGCPTIFVDRMADRLPNLAECDRHTVLVSVRNPALMSIPLEKQAQVYQDVMEIISMLRRDGYADVRLLCHDHRDIAFAASFPGIDYVYTGDVYTYLALLRACALNVTYRLHSMLPCLSFGTPTIKISYDERALSLVDTIGFGDWNIDMMQTRDVAGKVRERYKHLKDLRTLRSSVRPIWEKLHHNMLDGFRQFAGDVRAYRQQFIPENPAPRNGAANPRHRQVRPAVEPAAGVSP